MEKFFINYRSLPFTFSSSVQIIWILISGFLISTLTQAQLQPGEAAWNTADYYKREHSLGRPYQGMCVCSFLLKFIQFG